MWGIFWVLCAAREWAFCRWRIRAAGQRIGCQNASKQLRLQILREHQQRPASIVEGHSLFSRGEPVWTSAAERTLQWRSKLAAGSYKSQPLTNRASKVGLRWESHGSTSVAKYRKFVSALTLENFNHQNNSLLF